MSLNLVRKLILSISLFNLGVATPLTVYPMQFGNDNSEMPLSSMIAGAVTGVVPQLANQYISSQQQAALMAQRAKMMQTMRIGQVPNQKFPGCQFPVLPKPLPQKCREQEPSPANVMALGMEESRGFAAGQMANQLESLNLAGEEGGFKCLTLLGEGIKKDIEVSKNELTALQTNLKTQFEEAKILLDQRLDKVKTLKGHLDGGTPGDLDTDSFDLAKEFGSSECRNILTKSVLAQGRGLKGIRDAIIGSMSDKAVEYNQQRDTISGDIDKLFRTMQKNLNKFGTDKILKDNQKLGLILSDTQHLTQFKDFQGALQTEVTSIREQTEEAQELASQFEEDNQNFEREFQDKFVTNCVTGSDDSGFGMSEQDFINGLNFPSSLSGGNTQQNAEAAIKDIFSQLKKEQDVNLAIQEIEDFRRSYPNVTIRFTGRNAREEQLPPNAVFRRALGSCQEHYNRDEDGAQKLREIKEAHGSIQKTQSTFGPNLIKNLRNKILNCSGNAQNLKTSDCASGNAMNPGKPGFCIDRANLCARSIQKCEEVAIKKVKAKQNELAKAADDFNVGMAQLVAKQKGLLAKVNGIVNSKRNSLFAIAGVQGELPKGMQIAFPRLGKGNGLGVSLMGDGDFSSLEELPGKIDQIIEGLDAHGKLALEEIEKEKELQKQNVEQMITRLKEVETTCMAGMKKVRDAQKKQREAQQRQMQEFMKKQQEERQKAFKVCRDAMNMFSGPDSRPGCNGPTEKIADEIYEINVNIDPSYMQLANSIRSHCGESNEEGDRPQAAGFLKSICRDISAPKFSNALIDEKEGQAVLEGENLNDICKDFKKHLGRESGCIMSNSSDDSSHQNLNISSSTKNQDKAATNTNPGSKSKCKQDVYRSELNSPTDVKLAHIESKLKKLGFKDDSVAQELLDIGENLSPSCLGQQVSNRSQQGRELEELDKKQIQEGAEVDDL